MHLLLLMTGRCLGVSLASCRLNQRRALCRCFLCLILLLRCPRILCTPARGVILLRKYLNFGILGWSFRPVTLVVIGKFLHAHFELLAVQGVHGADFEERLKLLAEIWPRLLILLLLFLLLCLSRYDNLEHASLPRTTVHITTLFSSSESLPCIILNSCRL